MILYIGSDNILWAKGVRVISMVTGLPVYLDASVTAALTLYAADGTTEIDGETWPVDFTYIAGSQGDFLAPLRDTLAVLSGAEVVAHVTFNNGVDQLGDWRGKLYAQARTF